MFMRAHYKAGLTAGRPPIQYQLSGHFASGQDKLVLPFDIGFLKTNFLTTASKDKTVKKHEELGVSDAELEGFLKLLSIDVNAVKFEDQFQAIIESLVKQFGRSEEHTSELQSLMRISYAVFCLKKKKTQKHI